jgi:hypothetical protein
LGSLNEASGQPGPLRLLLIEALLVLCPTDTIAHCEASLAKLLDSLPEEEWSTLVQTVTFQLGFPRRKDEAPSAGNLKLDSMRFSYLIALKEPRDYGNLVFFKFFRTSTKETPFYLEFRQAQALSCAIAQALDWGEALSIVRECYARGVYAMDIDYQLRNSAHMMPSEIYTEVLSNARLYPIALCEGAEATASRAARKAVKPVSAIAKAERWFTFDR